VYVLSCVNCGYTPSVLSVSGSFPACGGTGSGLAHDHDPAMKYTLAGHRTAVKVRALLRHLASAPGAGRVSRRSSPTRASMHCPNAGAAGYRARTALATGSILVTRRPGLQPTLDIPRLRWTQVPGKWSFVDPALPQNRTCWPHFWPTACSELSNLASYPEPLTESNRRPSPYQWIVPV